MKAHGNGFFADRNEQVKIVVAHVTDRRWPLGCLSFSGREAGRATSLSTSIQALEIQAGRPRVP